MPTIWVLDTETTGLSPETDRVVEIAAVPVVGALVDPTTGLTQWRVGDGASSLVRPGIPIPPEASGVHHIIDSDVADAPQLGEALDRVLGPLWGGQVEICAAHNAKFDRGFLPPLQTKRWLYTWRTSMHVWPDAPSHKNMVLRYWRGIDLPREGAHRALADATVTAHLLC
jgi:exodeoxyribonuclease X